MTADIYWTQRPKITTWTGTTPPTVEGGKPWPGAVPGGRVVVRRKRARLDAVLPIRLSNEQRRGLNFIAHEEGVSVATIARRAIDAYLGRAR